MTIEEAIIDISEAVKPVVGGKSLDMAIEALKKRIPKKPDEYKIIKTIVTCPACGIFLHVGDRMKCCWECGQALDWGEIE